MGGLGGDSCPAPISVYVTAGPPRRPSLPGHPLHGLLFQNDLPGRTVSPSGGQPLPTHRVPMFLCSSPWEERVGGAQEPCPVLDSRPRRGSLEPSVMGAAPQAWSLSCLLGACVCRGRRIPTSPVHLGLVPAWSPFYRSHNKAPAVCQGLCWYLCSWLLFIPQ